MIYPISYDANPKFEDIQRLNDGIMEQAKKKKGMKQLDFFAFFMRDEDGNIVGGCAGDNMYGGLFVGQLWVQEQLRGMGYGTKLMHSAEALARRSSCNFMAVNTFDWEALGFIRSLDFMWSSNEKALIKIRYFIFFARS
ncbi:GNAT family N-acetyltransferase [Legionella feeleii]|uniref:N-acetyltransferase GCN5 n=1 Tax=Legionella feeleii TaxID=453 RepID=A0A2X1R1C2_9GAMM|nr:GNAT family N-acetyltransferase [Legionella feeleii]SPX60420.1 N-acetyltransferase GCN5 [Legionella feeleii]